MSRREPGRVLVELADPRVDGAGIEVRPGQLVQRRDDADVGRVRRGRCRRAPRPTPDVVRCRRSGTGLPTARRRAGPRLVPARPAGSPERHGTAAPTAPGRPAPSCWRPPRSAPVAAEGGGEARPRRRPAVPAPPSAGAGRRRRPPSRPTVPTTTGPAPVNRPAAQPSGAINADGRRDALPQRRDLARTLTRPSDRLRNPQPDGTGRPRRSIAGLAPR